MGSVRRPVHGSDLIAVCCNWRQLTRLRCKALSLHNEMTEKLMFGLREKSMRARCADSLPLLHRFKSIQASSN